MNLWTEEGKGSYGEERGHSGKYERETNDDGDLMLIENASKVCKVAGNLDHSIIAFILGKRHWHNQLI